VPITVRTRRTCARVRANSVVANGAIVAIVGPIQTLVLVYAHLGVKGNVRRGEQWVLIVRRRIWREGAVKKVPWTALAVHLSIKVDAASVLCITGRTSRRREHALICFDDGPAY
jgi:hypothetical protein